MDFQSLVETKLEPVGRSNNDIIYRCPQCEGEDGSGHLYVNYDRSKWHCFKCNAGGKRIESLLRLLHIDTGFDYSKLYSERDKDLDSIINPEKKIVSEIVPYSTDLNILTEYYNLHTTSLSPQAYQYLLKRGLTPDLIEKLDMREGISRFGENIVIRGKEFIGRDYSGRIMIPSRRKDGLISFYVGRDYIGDKPTKYMNPPKELSAASEDVWSLDLIDSSSIIICEGVFTAIAVNAALGKLIACATYGKSIAKNSSNETVRVSSQGEKLLEKRFKQYIVFYDKDAKKEAYSTASYLHDRGVDVRVVDIPDDMYGDHADAGDMTRDEIITLIRNSREFDNFLGIL